MLKLVLYNTQTRKKEEIKPLKGKKIRLYTCGPTVYNFAHIGNFRTYVFEDLLRRTIKFFGMSVEQVMNITDIDDKTIKGALDSGVPLDVFTKTYKEAFFEDLKTLHIEPAEHYPEATRYIPEMIAMIQKLLKKRIAYKDDEGNVFFAIHKFPSYGKLSHLNLEDLKAKASERMSADEYDKENVSDFTLWKAYDKGKDGDVFWQSPFGPGRPGWHIECSAMATDILGKTIDMHVGGVDNLFPHHENEVAQCEACNGKMFVKHWLHAEHLLVDHKKMSKSLGNFYTLRDLLSKGFSGKVVRMALLSAHYRTQLNFTLQGLEAAKASYERLSDCIDRLKIKEKIKKRTDVQPFLDKALKGFKEALSDDLNISGAMASVFDLVREINTLCDHKALSFPQKQKVFKFFQKLDKVLGFLPLNEKKEVLVHHLEAALQSREKARKEKNWKEADKWRDFLAKEGYLIEDTPEGPRLKKKGVS